MSHPKLTVDTNADRHAHSREDNIQHEQEANTPLVLKSPGDHGRSSSGQFTDTGSKAAVDVDMETGLAPKGFASALLHPAAVPSKPSSDNPRVKSPYPVYQANQLAVPSPARGIPSQGSQWPTDVSEPLSPYMEYKDVYGKGIQNAAMQQAMESSMDNPDLCRCFGLIRSETFRRRLLRYRTLWLSRVNPWIRMPLFVIAALVLFCWCTNLATWRHINASDFYYGVAPEKATRTLKLPDLIMDYMDAPEGPHHQIFYNFVSYTPLVLGGIMIIVLLWTQDMKRMAEVCFTEGFLMGMNAIAHVFTSLPDSYGRQDACHDPALKELGTWIFSRVSSVYCGDMMWSGHTLHTFMSLVIVRRVLEDLHVAFPEKRWDVVKQVWTLVGCIWMPIELYGLVFTRQHYTIDVFIGLLITWLALTNRFLMKWAVNNLWVPYRGSHGQLTRTISQQDGVRRYPSARQAAAAADQVVPKPLTFGDKFKEAGMRLCDWLSCCCLTDDPEWMVKGRKDHQHDFRPSSPVQRQIERYIKDEEHAQDLPADRNDFGRSPRLRGPPTPYPHPHGHGFAGHWPSLPNLPAPNASIRSPHPAVQGPQPSRSWSNIQLSPAPRAGNNSARQVQAYQPPSLPEQPPPLANDV